MGMHPLKQLDFYHDKIEIESLRCGCKKTMKRLVYLHPAINRRYLVGECSCCGKKYVRLTIGKELCR
jgi:hypothetical protein